MTQQAPSIICSADNRLFKTLHKLLASTRMQRQQGVAVLDGDHLLAAALDAGMPCSRLLVSESGLQKMENRSLLQRLRHIRPTVFSDALFRRLSTVECATGLIALLVIPRKKLTLCADRSVVILDQVQDPGNVGTLLRIAAAAGVSDVLLTRGCACVWSAKVLRAGMGGHFCLHIIEDLEVAQLQPLLALPVPRPVIATMLSPQACSVYALDLAQPVVWVFGAEGQGISAELAALADRHAMIPLAAGVESLNVAAAAAVCLFEQRRQQGFIV